MSRTIELPDPVYTALQEAASASGLTPAAWIAAHLPSAPQPAGEEEPPRMLADRFAGRVGRINSGGRERLSEASGDSFAAHLEAKRRAGNL